MFFDDVAYKIIVDSRVDFTLHHGSTLIIFDKSFPSFLNHKTIFWESLFFKITQGQVVCICYQKLNFSFLHLFFIIYFLRLSLFINLVPNPLTCSVEVIAKKAIYVNLSSVNCLKLIPPRTVSPFLSITIDSWCLSNTNFTIYYLGIFGNCLAKMFLRSTKYFPF